MCQHRVNELQRILLSQLGVDGHFLALLDVKLIVRESAVEFLILESSLLILDKFCNGILFSLVQHLVLRVDVLVVEVDILILPSVVELFHDLGELLIIVLTLLEEVGVLLLDFFLIHTRSCWLLKFANLELNGLAVLVRAHRGIKLLFNWGELGLHRRWVGIGTRGLSGGSVLQLGGGSILLRTTLQLRLRRCHRQPKVRGVSHRGHSWPFTPIWFERG
jgi:hypothetical protein